MKINEFLNNYPVFTRAEIENFWQKKDPVKSKAIEQILQYHQKKGHIVKIRRNLYANVPLGRNPDTYSVDEFLIASKITSDAVLGYHTALEFFGHAYSVHNRYTYLTEKLASPFEFKGTTYKPISFPKRLLRKKKSKMFVEQIDHQGLYVEVTSLERTLVDMLDKGNLSGGWEEIWRSYLGIGYLDLEKVLEYTKNLENATTAAKVGYFLEENKETFSVRNTDLQQIEQWIPKQPTYMDKRLGKGTLVKRWNLIVPDYIVNHGWEE
jgi:predicted transcriptional regulator of viral defense system